MKPMLKSTPRPLRRRFGTAQMAENSDTFFSRFLWLAVLHVVLGYLLYQFRPVLPTLYAFGVALAGMYVLAGKDPRRLAYVLVYIAGTEIVWRMTKADVFWEFGKYLTVGLVLLGILRWRLHISGLALLYFALLTPSIFLTMDWFSPSLARDAISFNLSGPLALSFCVIFFQNLKLDRRSTSHLLLVGILPVLSVSLLTLRGILVKDQILFSLNSNFATSGGFGPNQVSAIFSLGALFCVLYMFIARPSGLRWFIMLGLVSLFVTQSALTFSRGGVYNLLLAMSVSIFFFVRKNSSSRYQVFPFFLGFVFLMFFLANNMNDFTGGTLFNRFQDTNTTGRAELFLADIRIWLQNPLLGVGVGVSPLYHSLFGGSQIAAHTEYSRILAEHGALGIGSLIILGGIFLQAFIRNRNDLARGFLLAMTLWPLAEMAHAAMRIAAISIVFALPMSVLNWDETESSEILS